MNIHLRLANYISRYAPSKAKVTEYLQKKWIQNSDKILAEIGYNEGILLDGWMRTFINSWKGKPEIKRKLLLKKFEKIDIEKVLQKFDEEITDWENVKIFLKNFVENRLGRGKSVMILKQELLQKYPYFKDEILEFLENYSDEIGLEKEIIKYREKYNLADKKDEQKFYQALARKWFNFRDVKQFLEEEKEDL